MCSDICAESYQLSETRVAAARTALASSSQASFYQDYEAALRARYGRFYPFYTGSTSSIVYRSASYTWNVVAVICAPPPMILDRAPRAPIVQMLACLRFDWLWRPADVREDRARPSRSLALQVSVSSRCNCGSCCLARSPSVSGGGSAFARCHASPQLPMQSDPLPHPPSFHDPPSPSLHLYHATARCHASLAA